MALYQHDSLMDDQSSYTFDPERAHALISRYLLLKEGGDSDSDALGDALESIRPLANTIIIHYADELDREDVVQEVLLHLIAALPTFDRTATNLKPWLSTIIRHKAISLWRQRMQKQPDPMLPLREDLVAADEPEPEAAELLELPQTAVLRAWLYLRFPSIPKALAGPMAEIIIFSLTEGASTKSTVKALRQIAEPPLACNQIVAVYNAALVFLRAIGWADHYAETPDPATVEFSLVPELQLLLGSKVASRLYGLMRGMTVRYRIRN
jgi:RNA polymerase sigma factor (sigma-70 family)